MKAKLNDNKVVLGAFVTISLLPYSWNNFVPPTDFPVKTEVPSWFGFHAWSWCWTMEFHLLRIQESFGNVLYSEAFPGTDFEIGAGFPGGNSGWLRWYRNKRCLNLEKAFSSDCGKIRMPNCWRNSLIQPKASAVLGNRSSGRREIPVFLKSQNQTPGHPWMFRGSGKSVFRWCPFLGPGPISKARKN